MSTRQTSGDLKGVISGYEGNNVPDDIGIPSCGIADVDKAMYEMFDKQIHFAVNTEEGVKKAPVIFSSGERWAQLKLNKPMRDKNGVLILPLIAIKRGDITQQADDVTSRGINQHTGDIVIKRKLSKRDRAYQLVVNKLGLVNQDNLPVKGTTGVVSTKRTVGAESNSITTREGGLLASNLGDNIYEFITVPQPQFFTVNYEVTFWTSHIVHTNTMLEQLMAAYLPQGQAFKLESPKGYWFIAYSEGTYSISTPDDSTASERWVKATLQFRVPAYQVAPQNPGNMAPLRRYLSLPKLEFETSVIGVGANQSDASLNPGADDPTLGFSLRGEPLPSSHRAVAKAAEGGMAFSSKIVKNPFSGANEVSYARLVSGPTSFGESIVRPDESIILLELDDS